MRPWSGGTLPGRAVVDRARCASVRDSTRERKMRALLGVTVIAALLAGCTKDGEKAEDEAWRGAAANAGSQAEVALRYWCDPGASIASIRDSAAGVRSNLRDSASSIRAMMLKSQSEDGAEAHDRLIALADFAAVAHDLGQRATSVTYVEPDAATSDLRSLAVEQTVMVLDRLTPEEAAAFRAGESLHAARRRELAEMHDEQAKAFLAGMSALEARSGEVRRLEETSKAAGLDLEVLDRAAECLGEKLRPLYAVK